MKTGKLGTILAVIVAMLLFTACSETLNNVDDAMATVGAEKSAKKNAYKGEKCNFNVTLSDEESEGILKTYEEVKLANEVYQIFYVAFQHPAFNNIASSESHFLETIQSLIDGYLIENTAPLPGVFNYDDLTELYTTSIEAQDEELVDALLASVAIEEKIMNDLSGLLAATDVVNLQTVYNNLMDASQKHYDTFVKVLGQLGVTYVPEVISE